MKTETQICKQHENCILVFINDCEFHTNKVENRKLLVEEMESLL